MTIYADALSLFKQFLVFVINYAAINSFDHMYDEREKKLTTVARE